MRASSLLGLVAAGCVHAVPPTMVPDEVVPVVTADGWTNPLRHYPGTRGPVLLVHGMGANHYNWDFREEVSLAAWLRDRGWDVWVVELRGDPGSTAPDAEAGRRYTFDDHATLDLPAAVDAVRARTGAERVYWVGHSMGGMLLYTALEQYPEKIAAGVAVASPAALVERDPVYGLAHALRFVVKGDGMLPVKGIARATLPLGRHNPLYGRIANRRNLDPRVANGLARVALQDLPRPMARQALGWMEAGEVTRVDGTPWFDGADVGVPLLVLGAERDHVAPAANVAAACERFADCWYVHLSVEEGFAVDYGHVDPLLGRTARTEVFPLISQWLDAREGE